jgi:hypothetical protein
VLFSVMNVCPSKSGFQYGNVATSHDVRWPVSFPEGNLVLDTNCSTMLTASRKL